MNSTKVETKAAVKAQKKQQKLVKKQQLQKTEQLNKNQKNSIQTAKNYKNPTTTAVNHNNNNINSNNNNLNETNNNNNSTNISQKLREYYEQQQQQQQQKQLINNNNTPTLLAGVPNKFERSGSFSLKGKLSKLINSITSSKESLNKIEDDSELPFKFTRSRSMILPRRTNRRSLIEPQLEQLSEEDPTSPASPRKNSIENNENNNTNTPLRPQSMANQATSTPVDTSPSQLRKTSTPILKQDAAFDPVANFKKRRSSTLISSFKTTFGLSSEKKKDKLNDKWRASLQSLQAVDNMVSYENMSFIDYDKFNSYEKQLERKLSQVSLMDPSLNSSLIPDNSLISDNSSYILPSPCTPSNATATSPFVTPQTVVRRRKTSSSLHGSARELAKRRSASRNSFHMDPDYEHNLDKPRNVYRESLDSRKLELLNDISRNSYILDSDLVDILDLASTPLTARKRPYYKRCASQISTERTKAGQDVVDAAVKVQVSFKNFVIKVS
ncbi:signal transducer and activator of transcription B-like isoform X1 [Lucilia cuprina]|uniref:signal transducer and activator of transcription B-like isoform X1 n=1 Tax=Lucilia cuprina TaxID=7375 RepID=UPI001F0645A1|nr:signal transducer and activator of transcription B-like isoform X1 [Lucilia cuprina]XP_046808739.1 signal transducer and activator of transcription B-like isoform X1 [Lucilia cuprina]XP_046808740.1 signal transducer and activator of transcription B-like isoform X1 [Lucilia cuprina]